MSSAAPIQQYLDLGAAAHIDLLHANNTTGVHLIEDDLLSGFSPVGTFPRQRAAEIAGDYEDSMTPAYVGQQGFRTGGRRCLDTVTFLNAAYVDLDTYTTAFEGMAFSEVWQAIQERHPELPMPTIAGSSGRGLQLVWCFQTGKPKSFAPNWAVMADTLVAALREFGADPKARDLARVLRVSHSYNKKSGTRADLKQTGAPVTYEALQRWCNGYRKASATARPRPVRGQSLPANVASLTTKNAYTLHHARMSDYRTLAELRGGRFTDGRRRAIYLYACAAAWFCHDPDTLTNDVECFVMQSIAEPEKYLKIGIQQIIDRQGEAKQGLKRHYRGQECDPRYRHRNATIIEQLAITPAEQRHMKTIIAQDEKRARERLRRAAQRQKAGIPDRDTYLDNIASEVQERRQMVLRLASEGLTRVQIADQLGVSRRSVFRYLQGVTG